MVEKKKYDRAWFFSLLLHIVFLLVLVVGFEFSSPMAVEKNSDKNIEVIDAVVMNTPPTQPKFNPLPSPPKPVMPKPVEKPPVPVTKPKAVPPVPDPKVVEAKKQAIAIADKKLKKMREEKLAQQLLADIKKQTQKQQKKLKQKTLETEFAKEMHALNAKAKALKQQQLLREQKKLEGMRSQQLQGVVDKYKALITQAISRRWLVPGGVNKKLVCQLLIRLAPGGIVLDVQLVKSSGNLALDRSARDAVFKASPLPVPMEAASFEQFRQFVLKVKPENVMSGDV